MPCPSKSIICSVLLVMCSSRTEWAGGEGAEFWFSCWGKWWARGIEGEAETGVLSCSEACNYTLMADCTPFGIQKLVSASETRNAGGASSLPICSVGNAVLHVGCVSALVSEEMAGGKGCFSDFKGY